MIRRKQIFTLLWTVSRGVDMYLVNPINLAKPTQSNPMKMD
jgi:hypothetical protein